VSEPRFSIGDSVCPMIRGLSHNIMVIEGFKYDAQTKGWGYYCRKGENIWFLPEAKLAVPPPLDALAAI
jgi:hypothetical protein